MGIVRPDGSLASQDPIDYEIGEFRISTPNVPEHYLAAALQGAKAQIMKVNPVLGAKVGNPFQMEPGAQAVFMLVSNELKKMKERIDELDDEIADLRNKEGDGTG